MSAAADLAFFKDLFPDNQDGYFVAWWESIHPLPSRNGKARFEHQSAAYRTLSEFVDALQTLPTALTVRNLFCCVSQQRDAAPRGRSGPPKAIREIRNTMAIKALHADVDVKPGFYNSTDDGRRALIGSCVNLGVPLPTHIVYSSAPADGSPPADSGFHPHWALDRSLSPEEWRPLARAFSVALRAQGMRLDYQVITNPVAILRPPGSINRKYIPPGVARADPHIGSPCNVDALWASLAPYRSNSEPRAYDPDHEVAADLADLADAIEYRNARGDYVRGNYDQVLELHFGLADLVAAKPELRGDAWSIIASVVVANGRDVSVNEDRFECALQRSADRRGSHEPLVTARSIFKGALAAGWLPPHPEDDLSDEQRILLGRAKRKLWDIFRDGHHRGDAAADAARLAGRVRDSSVLVALAPSLAVHLARDGWDEPTILDAIELFKGHRDVGLARWAKGKVKFHA
jgi:hypothetical protein